MKETGRNNYSVRKVALYFTLTTLQVCARISCVHSRQLEITPLETQGRRGGGQSGPSTGTVGIAVHGKERATTYGCLKIFKIQMSYLGKNT